jgi:hypothetical protein
VTTPAASFAYAVVSFCLFASATRAAAADATTQPGTAPDATAPDATPAAATAVGETQPDLFHPEDGAFDVSNFLSTRVGFLLDSADTHAALGTGFRYPIARQYGMRIGPDVGYGDDGDWTVYVTMGTGWVRPWGRRMKEPAGGRSLDELGLDLIDFPLLLLDDGDQGLDQGEAGGAAIGAHQDLPAVVLAVLAGALEKALEFLDVRRRDTGRLCSFGHGRDSRNLTRPREGPSRGSGLVGVSVVVALIAGNAEKPGEPEQAKEAGQA